MWYWQCVGRELGVARPEKSMESWQFLAKHLLFYYGEHKKRQSMKHEKIKYRNCPINNRNNSKNNKRLNIFISLIISETQ